jgi:hypothetical protein
VGCEIILLWQCADAYRMLTGGADSTIKLWDLEQITPQRNDQILKPIDEVKRCLASIPRLYHTLTPSQKPLNSSIRHNTRIILPLRAHRLPLILLRPHPKDLLHGHPATFCLLYPRLHNLYPRTLSHRLPSSGGMLHAAPACSPCRPPLWRLNAQSRRPHRCCPCCILVSDK